MNPTRDPEAILAAWLDEGPTDLPDATRRAILTALPTTKQARRGPLAPWRFFQMNTYTRLAAAALVAVVAVGGALYLLGGNSGVGSQGPTHTPPIAPTPAPSPSEAATATPAIAQFRCAIRTLTWDGSSAIDLTGTWAGDDGGVYYLRQIGDQVWWLGMSGLGGPFARRGTDWTNVFIGKVSGDMLTGTYADVPQGRILDDGPVPLKLTPTSTGGISLVRTTPVTATGFGGARLTPCTLE
jgi:hypothetical protein